MEGYGHAKIDQRVFLYLATNNLITNIIVCMATALTAR